MKQKKKETKKKEFTFQAHDRKQNPDKLSYSSDNDVSFQDCIMLCFGFSSSFTLDISPVQLFQSCKRSDSRLLICTTVITTMADIYAEKPETKRALSSASQQASHTQAVISCCSLQPVWPEHP